MKEPQKTIIRTLPKIVWEVSPPAFVSGANFYGGVEKPYPMLIEVDVR
jgi:hypothetical protein